MADEGVLRKQLMRMARLQRENPNLNEEDVLALFEAENNKESPPFVPRTEVPCPVPSSSIHSSDYGMPPLTPSASFDEYTFASANPLYFPIERYQGRETVNPIALSAPPAIHIDPSLDAASFFEAFNPSLSSTLPTSEHNSLITPPDMAREASCRSQLAGAFGMVRLDSCDGQDDLPFEEDEIAIMTGAQYSDDIISPPSSNTTTAPILIPTPNNKRHSPTTVQDLHEKEVLLSAKTASPIKSPKRPLGAWPQSAPQSARRPYVRPRHPRVMCKLCPDNKKGFRGDHEYRRHYDRSHADKKMGYVVVDRSGTGFLSKCKACSSKKAYGVDYNATAHLKRQHFNPDKGSTIKAPENLRDWIEAVEVKVTAKRKRKVVAKKEMESEDESEDEMSECEEEEEDKSTKQPQQQQQQQQQLSKEASIYEQQCDERRQTHSKLAEEISQQALTAATNVQHWPQDESFTQYFTFEGSTSAPQQRPRFTPGPENNKTQQVRREAHSFQSSGVSMLLPGASLDAFQYMLHHQHLAPPFVQADIDVSAGVSMSDLFMDSFGGC
ncbi:hypothetical protein FPQ18DRAFT_161841 [Pyronema domesticum]|uniref:DUF7896 domain-containing protein n=1 Tax=Pyronema omphalodes (strain CBS 100304) TaxID=1076935 RepID=U4LPE8_PYROM|nr:hypothetical protein FPQ18DRAFT_161841 [Pyronema domesticum]CCX33452.1 Similar to hypothetical protein [Tuber melanosporum Mel28]; acc. no. XP_002841432 [Pyronema omphalodes CBS 100304]